MWLKIRLPSCQRLSRTTTQKSQTVGVFGTGFILALYHLHWKSANSFPFQHDMIGAWKAHKVAWKQLLRTQANNGYHIISIYIYIYCTPIVLLKYTGSSPMYLPITIMHSFIFTSSHMLCYDQPSNLRTLYVCIIMQLPCQPHLGKFCVSAHYYWYTPLLVIKGHWSSCVKVESEVLSSLILS